MVSVIIQRMARERQSAHSTIEHHEAVVDLRPDYLRQFPSASNVFKDLKLGVLLGRYCFFI